MAQLTTNTALTSDWSQVANSGESFLAQIVSGQAMFAYSPTAPAADFVGHIYTTITEAGAGENLWARSFGQGGATLVMTKKD